MPTLREKLHMRRRLLVDRDLQGAVVKQALLAALLAGSLLAFAGYQALRAALHRQALAGVNLDPGTVLAHLCWDCLPMACAASLLIFLMALRFSHRLAGPLVRFRRYLSAVASGYLPGPLRTRRGDLLQTEVSLLNEMLAGLSALSTQIQADTNALQEAILSQSDRLGADPAQADTLLLRLDALQDQVARLRREVDEDQEDWQRECQPPQSGTTAAPEVEVLG